MLKALTRPALALLAALCVVVTAAPAQTTLEWIVLSPAGEKFTARMPKQPTTSAASVEAGALKASGRRYAASADDGTAYAVWVMKWTPGSSPLDAEKPRPNPRGWRASLDEVAELAWELLVAPEVERLKRDKHRFKQPDEIEVGMRYTRLFGVSGILAREYQVTLEKTRGAVYVVSDESGAYVVAALGPRAGEWPLRPFLDSFALRNAPPTAQVSGGDAPRATGVGVAPGTGMETGSGSDAGGGAAVDYNRPFRQNEVTKKAVLTHKPEPGFTEQARRFWVNGTVRLRAILWANGEIRYISVVRGLPHGLTEKAIAAARAIKFEPAQKDGRTVSQYVVLEYNFNIY